MSDGVKSIGENIFEYCSSLTSVSIPKSVTEIGKGAFESCPSITVCYNGSLKEWEKIYPHVSEARVKDVCDK